MPLTDPVVAYRAGTNLEAFQVCNLLVAAGIAAEVIEDVSGVAVWYIGFLPAVHDPKVWVERADAARVQPLLVEYEDRIIDRRLADPAGLPVEVVCGECGQPATFPAAHTGTVQNCPHCRAYVDVGESAGIDGWDDQPPET